MAYRSEIITVATAKIRNALLNALASVAASVEDTLDTTPEETARAAYIAVSNVLEDIVSDDVQYAHVLHGIADRIIDGNMNKAN